MLISYFLANTLRVARLTLMQYGRNLFSLPPNMKYDVRCGLSYMQDGTEESNLSFFFI